MKCPFIIISTGLNVGPLAATTFQIARIYTYPKYAQCWGWDPVSRLKMAKSPHSLYMVDFVVFSLETGSRSQHCAYLGQVKILAIWNVVAARGPTFSPFEINMKGHCISLLSLKNGVIRLGFHSSHNYMYLFVRKYVHT